MYFQDIYSNLWEVKVFSGNIYFLKSKYIFLRDSYACPRRIFIFDGDQAQIKSEGNSIACAAGILYVGFEHKYK
jgi:hypothetical protein